MRGTPTRLLESRVPCFRAAHVRVRTTGLTAGGGGGTVYVGAHVRAHAGGARGGAKHAAALEAVSA